MVGSHSDFAFWRDIFSDVASVSCISAIPTEIIAKLFLFSNSIALADFCIQDKTIAIIMEKKKILICNQKDC